MKKSLLGAVAAFAILAGPATTFAQSGWTSPCSSSATIDETSTALYQVAGPSLLFRVGRTGTVTARYDVTNTAVPSVPVTPWTTFELGYFDPAGGNITATLFQVEPCTGKLTTICALTSLPATAPRCVVCTFPGGSVNFLNFLYFVQVDVRRTAAATTVQANTLRIF